MKPRTQEELDQWNAGAAIADATWWQQPHERGVGRTYEHRVLGETEKGVAVIEQVERGTL
jgi:hypothetical protein